MEKEPVHSLQNKLKTLPTQPGIYQYYDKDAKLIYVGKAKNLRNRVRSYFNKTNTHTGKVRLMVSRIADLQWMVTKTEYDALLLENNLIKEYQPRYNVMLKDDKTYPWICIKKEPFPRIFPTRNVVRDGSEYFGPYASVRLMNTLLDLIRQLYPLRTCKLPLTPAAIAAGRFSTCLQYQIGNCNAPCVGLQTQEEYMQAIANARHIIKGNIAEVKNKLVDVMHSYAGSFEFEKAHIVKQKIELLDKYQSKSLVVNPAIHNVDVFSFIETGNLAYVNFIRVVSGAILQTHTVELKKKLDETPQELLSMAVAELLIRFGDNGNEIVVPFEPDIKDPDKKYTIPQRGDKKQLLELSERNAKYFQMDRQKQYDLVDPMARTNRILETVKKDLRLNELPIRMECFDNSNFQGDYPVASMVVFTNAKPDKKEYRHFNIKTVEGPNDFASMEEVIYRRYNRLLDEESSLPQVIVVDGGKGQLSSAMASMERLGLENRVRVIGIAKRLEEIYFPGESIPLHLDKKSETLRLIQQMRDEAHRFGITHHRKRRDKGTLKTSLVHIPGVGNVLSQKLLAHFRSVKNIESASREDLEKIVGKAKAAAVYAHFHGNEE